MSLQTQHDPKNEAEITYWNSADARHWVERQQSQDIVLGPILQATLERAQLRQEPIAIQPPDGTNFARHGPATDFLHFDPPNTGSFAAAADPKTEIARP